MVYDEANLVSSRINGYLASEATLIQMAVSAVLSKEAGESFSKIIKRMSKT